MPKIDIAAIEPVSRSNYPPPHDQLVAGRYRQRLGDAGGLSQFGVNLTRLKPGSASSLRHWHENEDELVYILEGEAVLVENEGETVLRPGDAAAFKAGVENGHHLINRSDADVVLLEIGTRAASERAHYSDVDLLFQKEHGKIRMTRRSGAPLD
jgi:uncharacterized cupin superfamily protein